MKHHKFSVCCSIGVCVLSAILLLYWLFRFPQFFHWFYAVYHGFSETQPDVLEKERVVVVCFYACAPFAAASLALLLALLRNLLRDRVFIKHNVTFLRLVSWFCWAVLLITFSGGLKYLPLMIVAFAMGVVGTLLRVLKNVLQAAVVLREENDLTI